MFLPDRYVRGECPRCGAEDQLGDACEVCGATYEPGALRNPVSAVSGGRPELRDSEQVFVRLADFDAVLRTWVGETFRPPGGSVRRRVQPEIANKLHEWLSEGLEDWDISRNAPYFGFEIPDRPGKYFYVWLDAPIGYMASFENLCRRIRAEGGELRFDDFWAKGSTAELYHFIGKDIAYFHTLFWPAVLHGSGFRKPSAVFCHGFLTVNGEKMSKRRGTFVRASTYADHLDPEYLRYYFACNDFVARVNSDLVGKAVNIASRCARLLRGVADGRLAGELHDPALFRSVRRGARHHRRPLRGARVRSGDARSDGPRRPQPNRYIDEHKPWVAAREPEGRAAAHAVCSTGIELFPAPRRIPEAGPPRHGGEGRALPRDPPPRVERPRSAARRRRGAPAQPVRAVADADRSGPGGRHGGSLPRAVAVAGEGAVSPGGDPVVLRTAGGG